MRVISRREKQSEQTEEARYQAQQCLQQNRLRQLAVFLRSSSSRKSRKMQANNFGFAEVTEESLELSLREGLEFPPECVILLVGSWVLDCACRLAGCGWV
jgi:hypothetical protein